MSATADRPEDQSTRRSARLLRAVVVALLMLAPILPIAGSAWVLLAAGLPEYALDGDGALIELRVRNAAAGRQELGSYSRLGFDHPGPLHFYACVPLYEAASGRAASLNLSTAILQALSALLALALVARAGGVAALAAGSLLCTAYVGSLGQVLITAWDPTMMILPTLACFVASAAFAAGRSWALPAAVFTGVLAAQAHLSLVPPVGAALCAAGIVRIATRRRSDPGTRSRAAVVVALAIAVLALLPPLVEQLRGDPGNLSAIVRGLGGDGPHPSWTASIALASQHLTSFAARLVGLGSGGTATTVLILLQVALCGAAIRAAGRAGEPFTVALGWTALAIHAVSVLAIRRIVGEASPHMLLWVVTGGVLAWWSIGAAALSRITRVGRAARWAAGSAVAIGIGFAAARASERLLVESLVFVAEPALAARTPMLGPTADVVATRLAALGAHGVRLRVLDPPEPRPDNPQFTAAAGLALALLKRGTPFTPDPAHAFAYPRGLPAPAPPIATLVMFDAATRAQLATEGPFADVLDLGSWGIAIRTR